MFLATKKNDSSQASKVPKKRPSLVNLIQRHFHSPAKTSSKDGFASLQPPPPPPSSRPRPRKNPKSQFTTSAPEPRSSRSTTSLDSRPQSSLLPSHRLSHRRSRSATPTFIPPVPSASDPAPLSTSALAQTPSPTSSRASSPTHDDILKSQIHERRESSNIAVERKIWPAQHRYSQEKDPNHTSN